jgi:GntR family transcriptional regulator
MKAKRVIVDLIKGGEWPSNQLPPEDDLAKSLGISRTTVREALASLMREGIIAKKQGLGNLVIKSALESKFRFDLIGDFVDMVADAGHEPELRQSPPKSLKGLTVGPEPFVKGDFVAYDECLLADGQPAIRSIVYIPENLIVRPPSDQVAPIRNVGDFIADLTGRYVNHSVAQFKPSEAKGDVAQDFQMREGESLIAWNEVYYDINDIAICYTDILFNPKIVKLSMLRKGPHIHTVECPCYFDK